MDEDDDMDEAEDEDEDDDGRSRSSLSATRSAPGPLSCGRARSKVLRLRRGRPGCTWTGREYPLLVPRPDGYQRTVRDLADAPGQDRPGLVADMARSAWTAWSAHHDQIRAWLAAATARARPGTGFR